MSGVAIAARHSGTAAGKKSFEGEIISSHPGPGDDLTTVTAVVSEPMPKGSILRIRWDGAPYHVECHVDVPAEMQITMHVPKPTSELAMTGLRPNQNAYQALAQRAPLVKAAGANNWAKVKKLVKKGANVDAVDHEGRTALSHACSAGHKETVRMLLAAKATIDLADSTTVTPLMRAVVADKCEIIQMLLKAKADINYTDHNDVSALMVGAGADSLDAVKLLIQEGCKLDLISVNRADSGEGMALSALMFAARQGKIDMVRQLVKNGALLDIESSTNGWTAFHMACSEGEGDIVEILVKAGCNTSVKDVLGRTGKDIAEENGHPEIGDRLRALVVARMREQLMKQQQQKQLEPEPEGDGGDDPQPEEEEEGSDGGVAGSAEGTDAAATAAASKVVTAASAALEPESQSDSSAIVTGASGSGRANSWVRKGSHVVVNDGRMGVVMSEPLSSGKVILRLPDGSETLYIQASNLRLALEEEDYCYREYNPILTFGLKRLLTDKEAKELDATERLTGREFVESPHRPPEMECLWRNKTERLMALEPDGHLRMLHCLPREVIEAGRQTAFEMQGHFLDKYDGIYNQVGEHKGCPRFESATGKQLYYFAESFSWLLAPVFDPLSNKCDSFIAANSGSAVPAVPFGRREWKYGNGQKIMTCMVTCKPCRPEVRQIAPAPLLKDLDAEREKAPYAMVIDKHPLPAYNGVYRTIETHEGFPRYENAQGRQLYRYIPGEMWCLHGEFTPRINHCNAAIDSPLGNIPLGDQDWLVWTNGAHVMTTLNVSTIATAEEASKLWMKNLAIWNEMSEDEQKGIAAGEPSEAAREAAAGLASGLRAMLTEQGIDVDAALVRKPATILAALPEREGADAKDGTDWRPDMSALPPFGDEEREYLVPDD